jgi:hypothetical protein
LDRNTHRSAAASRISEKNLLALVVLALLLVGVFFRLWKLGTIPGVNGDEAWLGWKASEFARNGKLDWITNSGNLTSPFYILPLAVLHKIFTPSVELLRAVSVMSGLLVLPVNFLFCRKVYDLRTAWASTLLLALLPMNIVYSRFGWEPSQIVLFSLPVIYFSLWFCGSGSFFPSGLVLIATSLFLAFLVHPTTFFLSGLVGCAILARLINPEKSHTALLRYIAGLLLGFLLLGVAAILLAPAAVRFEMLERLGGFVWLGDSGRSLLSMLRIYNGVSALSYLPGSWLQAREIFDQSHFPSILWPDLIAFTALVFCVFILNPFRTFVSPKNTTPLNRRRDIVLLATFLGSACLFFLLNGPEKISVWNDRYGLWLVPIGILLVSRAWSQTINFYPSHRRLILALGVCVPVLFSLQVAHGYFYEALSTGGNSGLDARTASREIKEKAASDLLSLVRDLPQKPLQKPTLVSSDWFVYWPMVYCLRSDKGWKKWQTRHEQLYPHYQIDPTWSWRDDVSKNLVVFADFADSPSWKVWDEIINASGTTYTDHKYYDIADRCVLVVKMPAGFKNELRNQ